MLSEILCHAFLHLFSKMRLTSLNWNLCVMHDIEWGYKEGLHTAETKLFRCAIFMRLHIQNCEVPKAAKPISSTGYLERAKIKQFSRMTLNITTRLGGTCSSWIYSVRFQLSVETICCLFLLGIFEFWYIWHTGVLSQCQNSGTLVFWHSVLNFKESGSINYFNFSVQSSWVVNKK